MSKVVFARNTTIVYCKCLANPGKECHLTPSPCSVLCALCSVKSPNLAHRRDIISCRRWLFRAGNNDEM